MFIWGWKKWFGKIWSAGGSIKRRCKVRCYFVANWLAITMLVVAVWKKNTEWTLEMTIIIVYTYLGYMINSNSFFHAAVHGIYAEES